MGRGAPLNPHLKTSERLPLEMFAYACAMRCVCSKSRVLSVNTLVRGLPHFQPLKSVNTSRCLRPLLHTATTIRSPKLTMSFCRRPPLYTVADVPASAGDRMSSRSQHGSPLGFASPPPPPAPLGHLSLTRPLLIPAPLVGRLHSTMGTAPLVDTRSVPWLLTGVMCQAELQDHRSSTGSAACRAP